jgi:hypothetical protein
MGTGLAGQHRGCEERLLESLPPRGAFEKATACLANHAVQAYIIWGIPWKRFHNRVERCLCPVVGSGGLGLGWMGPRTRRRRDPGRKEGQL